MTEPTEELTLWERVDVRSWASLVRDVLLETYSQWRQDRTLRLGAGLAYYTLFTIVPFLALTAALASTFFGLLGVEEFLADRIAQLGVTDSAAAGRSVAAELERRSIQSTLGFVGLGTLIFTSSLVFLALVDAVNSIWHVPVRSGFRNSIRRRLVSFAMVLVTGAVIIGGFALSAVTAAAERFIPVEVPLLDLVSALVTALASGVALAVALILLFRFTGPVRTSWTASTLAAALTAVMMVLGTALIGWYLRTFGGSSIGGAFGALLLALTWVYYEAQIMLAGVQLVKVVTWRSSESTGDPYLMEGHPPADPSPGPTIDQVDAKRDVDAEEEPP